MKVLYYYNYYFAFVHTIYAVFNYDNDILWINLHNCSIIVLLLIVSLRLL